MVIFLGCWGFFAYIELRLRFTNIHMFNWNQYWNATKDFVDDDNMMVLAQQELVYSKKTMTIKFFLSFYGFC